MKWRTAIAVSGAVVAAALVVQASLVWACSSYMELKGPQLAPAGEVVQLEAEALPKDVELRWNDVKGSLLATGSNSSYSVAVPDVAPGFYYIVAVQGGQGIARSVLQVTAPAGAAGVAPAAAPALASVDPSTSGLVYRDAGSQGQHMVAGMKLLVFGSILVLGAFSIAAAFTQRARTSSRSTPSQDA